MDLIMHRVTKESGLPDSANGSMAKDTEPLGSTTKGGRHVGLDKMCLLMEVRMYGVRYLLALLLLRITLSSYASPRGNPCEYFTHLEVNIPIYGPLFAVLKSN